MVLQKCKFLDFSRYAAPEPVRVPNSCIPSHLWFSGFMSSGQRSDFIHRKPFGFTPLLRNIFGPHAAPGPICSTLCSLGPVLLPLVNDSLGSRVTLGNIIAMSLTELLVRSSMHCTVCNQLLPCLPLHPHAICGKLVFLNMPKYHNFHIAVSYRPIAWKLLA